MFQKEGVGTSWRYCVGARLKFWWRSRVPKRGSRDELAVLCGCEIKVLAAEPCSKKRE